MTNLPVLLRRLGRVCGGISFCVLAALDLPEPGQVTIYRDDWGVPHIYAAREEDGFYGLGYAQAEDQLEQLPPTVADALVDGVDRAMARMRERHGSTDLKYGDVFRVGRGGQSLPLGGGDLGPQDRSLCPVHRLLCVQTLRSFIFGEPDSLGQRWAASGSRLLRLVVFTRPLQSFTLHIYGQSERPGSPHYADQTRLFSEPRLKPTYFERAELMQHVESSRTLDVVVP